MRFIFSAIALTAAVAAPVAAAPADNGTVTVSVDITDIDLTSAEGRAALDARTEVKLREACTIQQNSRYHYGRDVIDQKCVADARIAVLAQAERVAAAELRSGREVAAN